MAERCEYNPVLKQPSWEPPLPTDCRNDATLSVGANGQWHVCDACAALPEFAKYRRRKPLKRDKVKND